MDSYIIYDSLRNDFVGDATPSSIRWVRSYDYKCVLNLDIRVLIHICRLYDIGQDISAFNKKYIMLSKSLTHNGICNMWVLPYNQISLGCIYSNAFRIDEYNV